MRRSGSSAVGTADALRWAALAIEWADAELRSSSESHPGSHHHRNPAPEAAVIRPFNPLENGPRKTLKMLQDQREILLSGGFP
jgi:hypothetical protein